MTQLTKSLADLKTEDAKLSAEVALSDYTKAIANTCAIDDLLTSAMQSRALMLKLTSRMVDDLLDAIDGVFDETETHYKMTDATITLMRELAHEVETAALPLPEFAEYFKRGAKPRDLLTVSQWADRNRWLESGTNIPGKWDTRNAPHLRDIMDDMSVHSPVSSVTFMKSSGVGGTEVLYNVIGYYMGHVQNKDVMAVMASLDLRDRSFNPKLDRLINETPSLSHINTGIKKSSTNRSNLLEFSPVGSLIKTGANSDEAARMDHVSVLLGDEVASWKDSATEGDRLSLFRNRLRSKTRPKEYLVSTPVNTEDAIVRAFNAGDQRYRYVKCPHCGEEQTLEFGGKDKPYGLKWNYLPSVIEGERIINKVWYLCKHNACVIEESEKDKMLDEAVWRPTYPHREKTRSYQINALYIKTGLGWSWKTIAQEFLKSLKDTNKLITFQQTTLGLPYEEQGEEVESAPLMLRREIYSEVYKNGNPWLIITAGVDVQKDRIEISFVGWGVGEEAWLIDHVIIAGDTAQADVWEDLAELFKTHPIKIAMIDSGYNTSMVYEFVRTHAYAVAGKGMPGTARPLVEDLKRRKQRLRTKRKKGVPVEPLGVDQGKAIIYSRLKQTEPGAGYIHFPQDSAFDDEYFAQLTAEKLVPRVKGMRTFYEWVPTRPRNEALDCFNYALAALKMLDVDWAKLANHANQNKPAALQETAPVVATKPAKKPNPFIRNEDW